MCAEVIFKFVVFDDESYILVQNSTKRATQRPSNIDSAFGLN